MKVLQTYSVIPRLPAKLMPLWDLAYNFLFAWNDNIVDLFSRIDSKLWREAGGNPVWFLNHLPQDILAQLAKDEFFLDSLAETVAEFRQYMAKEASAAEFPGRESGQPVVAYFSFEFGITHSMPIYSGGLGILAGDHLKSSSDLNIPLVGIGLCYQRGYFRQYLTPDGWQQERYPVYDYEQLPIKKVKDSEGKPVTIHLDLAGENLTVHIWRASVGRISLYLMDTNLEENPPYFRELTNSLYGGDLQMRLRQEILLGIGGIKVLDALGLAPKVIHMNEGHSAFAGLERIRVHMAEHGLSFEAAQELVASSSVFTTHTPVPAGNDRFPPELMQRYFEPYARDMGLAFKVFLALGREDMRDDAEHFCMTVLALRLSRFSNGVSRLHGQVSRNMWKRVWPQYPPEDVPIGAITNGIHVPSWVADDMARLFDRYLGSNWREDPDCTRVWNNAESLPDAELWRVHERLRERLVDYVRYRLRMQLKAKGAREKELMSADDILNPHALTIGFARRFATYKRAYLLLTDTKRLLRMFAQTQRPVQFVIAGKAHPQDNEGKKIIQQLVQLCATDECRASMVFLEDYDMEVAEYMQQGCDIWLNTPRRPLEACGTSGMKALANGVLNFSTLDGWWDEAYQFDNSVGWAIGRGEDYEDGEYQDFVESQIMYRVLESDIIPEFYDRGHGNLPRSWIHKMKKAFTYLGPVYNAHRMVGDYARKAYLPASEQFDALTRDEFSPARELAEWRMGIMTNWNQVQVRNVDAAVTGQVHVGDSREIRAEISLGSLSTQDLRVETYFGPLDHEDNFVRRRTELMHPGDKTGDGWQVYTGTVSPAEPGRFGFTVRVIPNHPLLADPHCLGLIRWA